MTYALFYVMKVFWELRSLENIIMGHIDWGSSLHIDISNLAWVNNLIKHNKYFLSINCVLGTMLNTGDGVWEKIHSYGVYSLAKQKTYNKLF